MKTIAQQLNIKEFPFTIKDKYGNQIYYEDHTGYWTMREYDSDKIVTYYKNSDGKIIDKRPKETITVNGIKYQRIEQ